ncbi:DUF4375 domain-containing protein [Blastococcus sp. TF02-9]|uniref:DMP19 family protein n=1 Tax=Blastococcus sp. TF02-09 TaxID=2250576 RepID=UPI0013150346|nr:DUF4375 domain-containing protein [Blastococcus sp. TF02-9]
MTSVDVWSLYKTHADDRSLLSPAQRQVMAVCDWRQEVNADGFENYFRAWGGDTAEEALALLPTVLGDDWAKLLREGMDLLGSPYPIDADSRTNRIDQGQFTDALNGLDERFYALEGSTDADARLNDFVRTEAVGEWPPQNRGPERSFFGRLRRQR